MRVNTFVLTTGQSVDVIEGDGSTPQAGVVLLHGSGTSERVSLRSLGAALVHRGIVSVIPDWHPAETGNSVSAALDFADRIFDGHGLDAARRTIVGYSAGGRIALGLTLYPSARFSRCVAVATSSFDVTGCDREQQARREVQVLLLHGDADDVRPSIISEQLGADLEQLAVDTQFEVIAGGTHATVVCAEFKPSLHLSNPAPDLTAPMHASVNAIARFVLV